MDIEFTKDDLNTIYRTIDFLEDSFDMYDEERDTYYDLDGLPFCDSGFMNSLIEIKNKIKKEFS